MRAASPQRRFPWALRATLIVLTALGLACTGPKGQRASDDKASLRALKLETNGLVIGEFEIDGAASVLDGDTIVVKGLPASLRLLAIDTEETFKKDSERDDYDKGFEMYLKRRRGDSARPVKSATPLGEDAKRFAQEFFQDVTKVRLERDHPLEVRDFYGRFLAYVFAYKNGEWINFNLETVKVGMSPYFVKYGRSRRFDAQFKAAQATAQERRLGIWDPRREHYDDYPERLAWWEARAVAIDAFEKKAQAREDTVVLTRADATLQLEQRVGQSVLLFGAVSDVLPAEPTSRAPTRVRMSRNRQEFFELVFFDDAVFAATGIADRVGEYIEVYGTVTRYPPDKPDDRRAKGPKRLQIIVRSPKQVHLPAASSDNSQGAMGAGPNHLPN